MAITAPTDAQLSKAMLDALNARILEAAEPIIEKAAREFEIEIACKAGFKFDRPAANKLPALSVMEQCCKSRSGSQVMIARLKCKERLK